MIHLIGALMITMVLRKSSELPVPGGAVVSVDLGKTAEIWCTSNDQDHNFLFWQISSPIYGFIGPGNDYDRAKYEYEVLSGKLIIRGVTKEEEGIYNCVSRGVRNDHINIRPVTVLVRNVSQVIGEEDPIVIFYHAVVAVGAFAILLGGAYLMHSYCTSKSSTTYKSEFDADEGVAEPLEPSTSSTQKIHEGIYQHEGYENTSLSTDFENFLKNTNR